MKLLCQADCKGITHLLRGGGLDLPGEGWICQGREEMCQERAGIAFENSRKMRVKSIYAEAPHAPAGLFLVNVLRKALDETS